MRRPRFLAFLAGLAIGGSASATTVEIGELGEIPVEYHGRWQSRVKACASPPGRDRLLIARLQIVVGGDRFQVEGVSQYGARGIGVSSRYVGPGSPWNRTDHFTLSSDGTRLTALRGGRSRVLRRCKA